MDLPPFSYTINLPAHVTPIDAWGIFQLFFPENQLQIICDNTNQRQEHVPFPDTPGARAWDWKPMVLAEAYHYLGIRIYMGIHKEDCFEAYWKPPTIAWPGHPVRNIMALRRFQSLYKAFRLCTGDPDHEFQAIFERLEPLNDHIRTVSQQLWSPGRDLAIDESMSRFQGGSLDILKIPGKPIEEGYKVWVLAQMGYFWDWVFHRKGTKNDASRGKLGPWRIT
ncbi:hypothetical protein DL98DRAFT_443959 [Cadophora sp. DSE1049]|nr:hypothetical protein DL98DRAFT_443959 [Cadophora sp. DSE1049]